MKSTATSKRRPTRRRSPEIRLPSATAGDLMTHNPVSIRQEETVKEAAALLTDRGFSGVPVINSAGRPVGVLSRSDIVRYERERVDYRPAAEPGAPPGGGFQIELTERSTVRQYMTPTVFAVRPEMPMESVILEMLAKKVHRLFVVDDTGVLVGVISPIDILRRLVG